MNDRMRDMLAYIRAEGPFRLMPKGITTYPGSPSDDGKHAVCLALEEQELIYRRAAGLGWVTWMPVEEVEDAQD